MSLEFDTKSPELHSYPQITFKNCDFLPPSYLYSLPPIGIGTAHVESLTSYISRLAEAHCVCPQQLFNHILVPDLNRKYMFDNEQELKRASLTTAFREFCYSMNGMNQMGKDCIDVLEKLTLQTNLKHLTMLPWKSFLSHHLLIRHEQTWCQYCLAESREKGEIVYEHLTWNIKLVNYCVKHHSRLITVYPFCRKKPRILDAKARSGYCNHCGEWVGTNSRNEDQDIFSESLRQKEIRIAGMIGDFLASSNEFSEPISRDVFTQNLIYCIDNMTGGNFNAFAKFAEIGTDTTHNIYKHKAKVTINSLVRICECVGISLNDFIFKQITDNFKLPKPGIAVKLSKEEKIILLQEALEDPNNPPLSEVAKKLGYKGTLSMYRADSDICKKITANNRSTRKPKVRNKSLSLEVIEKALGDALKRFPPPTLTSVCKGLGHADRSSVRQRSPRLAKQIVARYSEYSKNKNKQVEKVLRATMKEIPPPSLPVIAKRLGFKSASILRSNCPELYKAISDRFAKNRLSKKVLIERTLKLSIIEFPPPSVNSVARKLETNVGALYKCNNELCYQIAKRYLDYSKELSIKRKLEWHNEIRQTAERVFQKQSYISRKQFSKLLTKSVFRK